LDTVQPWLAGDSCPIGSAHLGAEVQLRLPATLPRVVPDCKIKPQTGPSHT